MSSFTRLALENWIKTIDVTGKVADIGGTQLPIKTRVKSWEVGECKTFDLPEYDLNIKWYENFLGQDVGRYDTAFCLEVSEYLYDPLTSLKNMNYILKRGGTLYFTSHLFYGIHPPKGTDYLRYTPDGVDKLLEEAGFRVVEHKHRMAKIVNMDSAYRQEGMRIRKDYNHQIIGSLIKATKI